MEEKCTGGTACGECMEGKYWAWAVHGSGVNEWGCIGGKYREVTGKQAREGKTGKRRTTEKVGIG
jgi:hypothetical protein